MKKQGKRNIKDEGTFKKVLNPAQPQERRELIKDAVARTIKEYGEALKKLGSE